MLYIGGTMMLHPACTMVVNLLSGQRCQTYLRMPSMKQWQRLQILRVSIHTTPQTAASALWLLMFSLHFSKQYCTQHCYLLASNSRVSWICCSNSAGVIRYICTRKQQAHIAWSMSYWSFMSNASAGVVYAAQQSSLQSSTWSTTACFCPP